jgi:hypothetical protein
MDTGTADEGLKRKVSNEVRRLHELTQTRALRNEWDILPPKEGGEARKVLLEQRRLEAVANDEEAAAFRREAARRDIKAIIRHLRSEPRRPTDETQRAVRAVRIAIKRFHRNLVAVPKAFVDARGRPARVLAAFARHLERHVLIPSARFSGARARQARGEMAGCFVYEAPQGVVWKL